MTLPLMPELNIVYFLDFFLLKPVIPVKREPKRSVRAKVVTGPNFRAAQLTPTKSSKLQRANAGRV